MTINDVPKYRVRPKPTRFLINKISILAILGIIMYFGIYLNTKILKNNATLIDAIILITIIIFIFLDGIYSYIKFSNYSYEFYNNKLVLNENKRTEIKYSDIINTSYSANIIDKKMLTGTFIITLKNGKVKKIKYLKNPNQTFLYLQKIVNHTKKSSTKIN